MNGANEVIERRIVTIGLLDRAKFTHAKSLPTSLPTAAAVIFAHNHPSGDPTPSEADLATHEQLTQAAKLLGIRVLDHIIVTKTGYYSYQQSGLIQ